MSIGISIRRTGGALFSAAALAGALPAGAGAQNVGEVVSGTVTVGNETVETASQPVYETGAAAGQEVTYAVKVISYAILTSYRAPNGDVKQKLSSANIGAPAAVDVTGEGAADIEVKLAPTSTELTTFKLEIKRLPTALAPLPVTIEALVNEPSANNHVINVGYDALTTSAPQQWTATATVTVNEPPAGSPLESDVGVDATVVTTGAPSSMTLLGGRYTQGTGGQRVLPQDARLALSPVPAMLKLGFLLEPSQARKSAQLSASSATTAILGLTLTANTGDAIRVNGKLKGLRKPVKLLIDHIDANNQPTGTDGRQRVRLTTGADLTGTELTYEERQGPETVSRLRLATGPLPKKVIFIQNPTGIEVGASEPISSVAGGIALGRRSRTFGQIAVKRIAVPNALPVVQNLPTFVQQDTTDGVSSTTFRVARLRQVRVNVDGPVGNRVMTIAAKLKSAGTRVIITDDGKPVVPNEPPKPSRFDIYVHKVPHNFSLKIAPNGVRKVEFCGSSAPAVNPCSAKAQESPAPIKRILIGPSFSSTPLFARATHLQGVIQDIPSKLSLDVVTHAPDAADPNTRVHIDASRPIGLVALRATDGKPAPAAPKDDGFLYRDRPGEPYYVIAKVHGLRSIHVDTAPKLDIDLQAEGGHTAEFQLNLPPTDAAPNLEIAGRLDGRPARSHFVMEKPRLSDPANPESKLLGKLGIWVDSYDAAGKRAVTKRMRVRVSGISNDPKAKVHNVIVDATDVPGGVSVHQQPTADKTVDLKLSTVTGAIGSAFFRATNSVPPHPAHVPAPVGKRSYVTGIIKGEVFFVESKIRGLADLELNTTTGLSARLNTKAKQDLAIHLDLGESDNYRINDGCPDFDPDEHNGPHPELYDIVIKDLKPNLRFSYQDGTDGNTNKCEVKTHRLIEYSSDGRAKSIQFDTTAGDLAHLTAFIGKEKKNPLRVPKHLSVCQATYDYCLKKLGRTVQCSVNHNCDTADADMSVYLDSYQHRTHVRLAYCKLNTSADGNAKCRPEGTLNGTFVDLNLNHLDLGYAYDAGAGFLSMNTKSKSVPNHWGVTGSFRYIDHTNYDGVGLEYATIGFGYDDESGKPPWDPSQGSKWHNYFGVFSVALPVVGTKKGDVDCESPGYFGQTKAHNTYFKVILEVIGGGNSPNDPGDNLTNLLCGLF